MGMDEKARLDAFEKMLHAIRENYQNTDQKMKRLKEEGKEKKDETDEPKNGSLLEICAECFKISLEDISVLFAEHLKADRVER